MASLTKNGGTYALVWTDSSRRPKQVGESLKTESHRKAKRLKARLEDQYFTFEDGERKHDPWRQKWYERSTPGMMTVPMAVEEFITYKAGAKGQQGWSDRVAKNETFTMRKFARHVGDMPLESLTEKDLEGFYYRDGVNSDHTRNSLYISVNTFLNWCMDKDYLEVKPEFKPKKPQTKVPKFIELDEIRTVYEAEDWEYVKYGWLLLASTGMRPVELANLKTSAVHSDHIIIGEDFTTKVRAERRIPLLFESEYAIEKLTSPDFDRSHSPEYLLGRKPSTTRHSLSHRFSKRWKKKFPNKKRSLYNLKNTFAVRFLSTHQSGMAMIELKNILGHASIKTTERYLQALPYGTTLEGAIL